MRCAVNETVTAFNWHLSHATQYHKRASSEREWPAKHEKLIRNRWHVSMEPVKEFAVCGYVMTSFCSPSKSTCVYLSKVIYYTFDKLIPSFVIFHNFSTLIFIYMN